MKLKQDQQRFSVVAIFLGFLASFLSMPPKSVRISPPSLPLLFLRLLIPLMLSSQSLFASSSNASKTIAPSLTQTLNSKNHPSCAQAINEGNIDGHHGGQSPNSSITPSELNGPQYRMIIEDLTQLYSHVLKATRDASIQYPSSYSSLGISPASHHLKLRIDELRALVGPEKTHQILDEVQGNLTQKFASLGLQQSTPSESRSTFSFRPSRKIVALRPRFLFALKGLKEDFYRAQFTPDQNQIITLASHGALNFWDANNGQLLGALRARKASFMSFAINEETQSIVTTSNREKIQLWSLANTSLQLTRKFKADGNLFLSLSENGTQLLTSGSEYTTLLWDIDDKIVLNGRLKGQHGSWVNHGILTPDGQFAITGSDDSNLVVWETQTHSRLHRLTDHKNWIAALAVSPSGEYFVSGSADQSLILWETQTGKKIRTFEGHEDWISTVQFSHDGRFLASASTDEMIKIWKVETGEEMATITDLEAPINSLAFSADDSRLLGAGDGGFAQIWSLWATLGE